MIIYLVSSGSYSDYSVDYLFTNKENAERFVAQCSSDGYPYYNEVQEFETVDSLGESHQEITLQNTIVDGVPQGTQERVETVFDLNAGHPAPCEELYFNINLKPYSSPPGSTQIYFTVAGSDLERCRKVNSEKVAHTIASYDLIIEAERLKLK